MTKLLTTKSLIYLEDIAPEKKKIVKLYTGKEPLFDNFGITKQIKSSFGKTVPLKNGAYLKYRTYRGCSCC
jgi:ribonuclease G